MHLTQTTWKRWFVRGLGEYNSSFLKLHSKDINNFNNPFFYFYILLQNTSSIEWKAKILWSRFFELGQLSLFFSCFYYNLELLFLEILWFPMNYLVKKKKCYFSRTNFYFWGILSNSLVKDSINIPISCMFNFLVVYFYFHKCHTQIKQLLNQIFFISQI